jgi:hypothetical protein
MRTIFHIRPLTQHVVVASEFPTPDAVHSTSFLSRAQNTQGTQSVFLCVFSERCGGSFRYGDSENISLRAHFHEGVDGHIRAGESVRFVGDEPGARHRADRGF